MLTERPIPTPRYSIAGERFRARTGVRRIMQDIEQTLSDRNAAGFINLSAGNPLRIAPVAAMWRQFLSAELERETALDEAIGRYGSSRGYFPFIAAIVDCYNEHYGWNITEKNVVITPGSQSGLFYVLNAFCGPRSDGAVVRVCYPQNPDYTGYQGLLWEPSHVVALRPQIELTGERRFRYGLDIAALADVDDIGCFVLSRPCNPSGNVASDAEMATLMARAEELDVPLVVDGAYGPPFPNLVEVPMQLTWGTHVIHSTSLSKCGLPGERIGILIGDERWIESIEAFQSNACLHSSRLGQLVASQAIATGSLERLASQEIRPLYSRKRAILQEAMQAQMPTHLTWRLHEAHGALFSWLWVEGLAFHDGWAAYERLKGEGVLCVPGVAFFQGMPAAWRHQHETVRISLTASDEDLVEGVRRIARAFGAA
jgi:valine--pyruvate aminotransferase